MPTANVFRALGLFVADGFLSKEECIEYRSSMALSALENGTVLQEDSVERVDETRRRVQVALVPRVIKSAIKNRLSQIKSRLEEQFRVLLGDCEAPQFLVYGPGGLHVPHSDSTGDLDAPGVHRQRAVSIVIFVNTPSERPSANSYVGGSLAFYGLIKNPVFNACGLPIDAEPGMLVAFPSSTIHEVRPVTHGQRHTIVTWFPFSATATAVYDPISEIQISF